MSTAVATTITPAQSTDALFRAWGSTVSAQLAAAGLVQTADTGQINWTTVVFPTAANQVMGYEIWRLDDTLQATAPVFLKIEYGAGTSAINPGMWIQLGSGSNGAGGLSGILSVRQQVTCTPTVTPVTVYFSGDTNRFGMAMVAASAALSLGWFMERTKDATGADTAEGVLLATRGSSIWNQIAWNCTTGCPTAAWETSLGAMGMATPPYGTSGAQVAVFPVYHTKGVFYNPGLNLFSYYDPSITPSAAITFTVYGASHTFMPLPSTQFGGASAMRSTGGTLAVMMRFE